MRSSGRVRVLPDAIVNRIAAGEVVERPSSAVKELVENAVDAGASRVRVRLEAAGKALLAVEDDGEGMGREDAVLAIERHATSKISSLEDLDAIRTLGFRGEALSSIAAVSRLRLATRRGEDPEGTEIRVEGGRVVSVEAVGSARGTAAEVSDLFYNVPARKKFLKGDSTELRSAVDAVTQLALVHFDVGFELKSGSRLLLAVPSGQALEERTADLAGAEAPGGLSWHHAASEGREIVLAFGAPHESRGHRRGVRLFVNRRPVQDRLLFRALLEGYRGTLEPGRYPVALLWVRVSEDEVDVNVHPTKREVRFRDEGRIFRWVCGVTSEALASAPWARGGARRELPLSVQPGVAGSGGPAAPRVPVRPEPQRVAEALAAYAAGTARGERLPLGGLRAWPEAPPASAPAVREGLKATGEPPEVLGTARGRFGALRYLGAFDATYLLFEDLDGRDLVVLDQHAAHERILYEALLDSSRDRRRAQPLLFPSTIECSPAEMAAYAAASGDLEALGFDVAPFGPSTLVLRATPPGMGAGAAELAVRDLLGAGEGPARAADPQDRLEAVAGRAACAAAVKARTALAPSEAAELLRRLEGLQSPAHCPHGRPLLVRLSRRDLEAMFHRA